MKKQSFLEYIINLKILVSGHFIKSVIVISTIWNSFNLAHAKSTNATNTVNSTGIASKALVKEIENIVEYSIFEIYNRSLFGDVYFNISAEKNCDLQVRTHKDFTNLKIQKDPCMANRILFKYDELIYHGCEWRDKVPESPVKSFGREINKMKVRTIFKNVEIFIDDETLKCRADLEISGSDKSVKIEGPCAPVKDKVLDQKLSHYKPKPVIAYFEPVQKNNELQNSINEVVKLKTDQISLVMVVAIPLPQTVSQYIHYLLSSQADKDCRSVQKK